MHSGDEKSSISHPADSESDQIKPGHFDWDFRAALDREAEWELELLADELDEAEMQLASAEVMEVQELTWALLDQRGTPEQMRRLSALMLSDREARAIYLECVQLHAELEDTLLRD